MKSTEPVQVHCSKCARGGNGDKSCSCGWNEKKFSPKKYYEGLLEDLAVRKIFKEKA